MREITEGEGEREATPHPQAESPVPGPRDHHPNRGQTLNPLSHPRAPPRRRSNVNEPKAKTNAGSEEHLKR